MAWLCTVYKAAYMPAGCSNFLGFRRAEGSCLALQVLSEYRQQLEQQLKCGAAEPGPSSAAAPVPSEEPGPSSAAAAADDVPSEDAQAETPMFSMCRKAFVTQTDL